MGGKFTGNPCEPLKPADRVGFHSLVFFIQGMGWNELLQYPQVSALEGLTHSENVIFLDQMRHTGGAKFVRHPSLYEKANAFEKIPYFDRMGVKFIISLGCGFQIKGNVVDKSAGHKTFETAGQEAIGIQLDLEAKFFDFAEQFIQFGSKRRFTPGDHNPINKILALLQFVDNILEREIRVLIGVKDQAGVVTERAGEITAAQKNQGRNLPRIIE